MGPAQPGDSEMFPQTAYFTACAGVPDASGLVLLAGTVFRLVFRRDFTAPGVALLELGPAVESFALRRFMVDLKGELDRLYRKSTGRRLVYLSLARFDQQVTTKFHLDGAPEEAYLMLGYEPSEVRSELSVADYSRTAFEMRTEPKHFLADFNPMFANHEGLLAADVTPLTGFHPAHASVVVLNNSSLPYDPQWGNSLGVMHQATILTP